MQIDFSLVSDENTKKRACLPFRSAREGISRASSVEIWGMSAFSSILPSTW